MDAARTQVSLLVLTQLLVLIMLPVTSVARNNPPIQTTAIHDPSIESESSNSLYCTMEQVAVMCLINRGHRYIYPFECLLNRTSKRFTNPKLMMAYAPDPIHLSPVPVFPFMIDFWQQDEESESGKSRSIQSCPCNCEIDCKSPVSRMYEIRKKTACHDCTCLTHSGIGCTCYDKYDLMFKDMDAHMERMLSKHAARSLMRRAKISEELDEQTTPKVTDN